MAMTGRWVSPHVPNRAPAAEATLAVMIIKAPMRPDLPPAAAAKPQQTRASTQYRAMTIASGRSRACMSCQDHRPWQYASRGGGFDLHIADLCRNIRNASGRTRLWFAAGAVFKGVCSAECPEKTGDQDRQCNHRRQSQNRDLQDAQSSRCAI